MHYVYTTCSCALRVYIRRRGPGASPSWTKQIAIILIVVMIAILLIAVILAIILVVVIVAIIFIVVIIAIILIVLLSILDKT